MQTLGGGDRSMYQELPVACRRRLYVVTDYGEQCRLTGIKGLHSVDLFRIWLDVVTTTLLLKSCYRQAHQEFSIVLSLVPCQLPTRVPYIHAC